MIDDREKWERLERWELEQTRREPVNVEQNLRLMEAMYLHARAMGTLAGGDPLDGIDVKIKLAKALSRVQPPPGLDRQGP